MKEIGPGDRATGKVNGIVDRNYGKVRHGNGICKRKHKRDDDDEKYREGTFPDQETRKEAKEKRIRSNIYYMAVLFLYGRIYGAANVWILDGLFGSLRRSPLRQA